MAFIFIVLRKEYILEIMVKLDRSFYNRDTLVVAKELLGKILVHNINGVELSGRIVETEAYMGVTDKAAHSYGGRKTKRVEPMYGLPGFAYIYFIYGMYYCFNVVTREEGIPQAVLIRALEPATEVRRMAFNRFNKDYEDLSKYQKRNITNGPGKLCMALAIDKSLNKQDLCGDILYVEQDRVDVPITTSKRIGIDYAGEAKDYPWRFYVSGNPYVSVK